MKKFIFKLVCFFLIMAIIDFGLGKLFGMLPQYSKGGDTLKAITISDKMTDDVLVFGSSRAFRHYIPQILEDSIGMSVYNCGLPGYGIIFNYGQFLLVVDRYTPHLVIYDITPKLDLYDDVSEPNERCLGPLRLFYDRDGIQPIFDDVNPAERYKMISGMYRHNKRFIQMITDIFMPQRMSIKGYIPLVGKMNYEKKEPDDKSEEPKHDVLKLKYLEKLASDCHRHGIRLIFAISPEYGIQLPIDLTFMEDLCDKYGSELWNYRNDPDICMDPNKFVDALHMNEEGATIYTNKIARRINNTLDAK